MELQETEIFGRLGSMSLADIVQILGVNKKTATLVLKQDGLMGKVFFKDGMVLHAFAGNIQGETAILKFLEWARAEFVIEEGIASIPMVTMFAEAEALMLRMCSRLDEAKRESPETKEPPAADSRPPTGTTAKPVRRQKRANQVLPSMAAGLERKKFSLPLMIAIAFTAIVLSLYFPSKFLTNSRASVATEPPAELDRQSAPVENATETSLPAASLDDTVAALEANALYEGDAIVEDSASDVGMPDATTENPNDAPAVEPTATTSVPIAPKPAFGNLLIVAEPWAEVFIDGERMGETPLGRIRLSAGAHDLTLSNDNFAGVITDTITIPGNATLSKRYSFNNHGYLQIVVLPWADVYVDGRHVGQTPLEKLKVPVGTHTVTLRHPQLGEKQMQVDIRSLEATLLRLEM